MLAESFFSFGNNRRVTVATRQFLEPGVVTRRDCEVEVQHEILTSSKQSSGRPCFQFSETGMVGLGTDALGDVRCEELKELRMSKKIKSPSLKPVLLAYDEDWLTEVVQGMFEHF